METIKFIIVPSSTLCSNNKMLNKTLQFFGAENIVLRSRLKNINDQGEWGGRIIMRLTAIGGGFSPRQNRLRASAREILGFVGDCKIVSMNFS